MLYSFGPLSGGMQVQGSMPWKVSGAVEKRKAFVEEWLSGEWTMTELCARHSVSRQTGYNTVARYQSAGWESLEERSRSPLRHPNQTRPEIEQAILMCGICTCAGGRAN